MTLTTFQTPYHKLAVKIVNKHTLLRYSSQQRTSSLHARLSDRPLSLGEPHTRYLGSKKRSLPWLLMAETSWSMVSALSSSTLEQVSIACRTKQPICRLATSECHFRSRFKAFNVVTHSRTIAPVLPQWLCYEMAERLSMPSRRL